MDKNNVVRKYDDYVFKILIRTFKDCGIYNHFKSKKQIVERCYGSRLNYAIKDNSETIFQNLTYWVADSTKGSITDETTRNIRAIYVSRLVNNLLVEKKISPRTLTDNFFVCFYDAISSRDFRRLTNKYGMSCIYEIEKALNNIKKHYPKSGFNEKRHNKEIVKIVTFIAKNIKKV